MLLSARGDWYLRCVSWCEPYHLRVRHDDYSTQHSPPRIRGSDLWPMPTYWKTVQLAYVCRLTVRNEPARPAVGSVAKPTKSPTKPEDPEPSFDSKLMGFCFRVIRILCNAQPTSK